MKFALFLTRGMSLTKWEKIGILDREIKPYLELAKEHDVTIFTYGKDKPIKGLTILPVWKSLFLKFDYLKTNQMDGALMAVLNKKLHGGKLVVRCGYEWLRSLEKTNSAKWKIRLAYLIEKIVYKKADKVVITSYTEADFIEDRFDPKKIIVIPNYIDMERFKPMDYPKERGRVLFVGRLEPEKDFTAILEYIYNNKLKLVCIGAGSQKEYIKNYAEAFGINVEFKGVLPQSKLPEEYNRSEYYIQLSVTEGCSKTLLEARACGCKCIVSDIPNNKEIMDRPITDFSFENIMKLEKQLYEG